MTEGQVFGARRNPATPVDRRDDRAPNYYLDWAFDEMKKLVDTFPKSMTERVFVVRTALDTNLQNAADTAIENSLRQYGQEYQRPPGRRRAHGRRRLGARHGGRPRLRRQPVQPRHRRDAPARLLVQALRLRHRARTRIQTELDRGRRADLPRQLVSAQLRPRLWRLDDADQRAHPFDQYHRRAPVGRRRRRQSQARPRAHHQDRARHGHHAHRCPTRRRCRSAPTRSPCSTISAPTPPSPISARR